MAGTCCNLSQIMSDPLFAMEVSAVETLFEAGDVLENIVELLPSTVLGNVPKRPNACPHRRSLQFFVKSTVRPSEFRILHSHRSGMMLCGPIAEAETCENCSLQDQVTRSKRCMRPLSHKRPLPKRSNSMALSGLSPQ